MNAAPTLPPPAVPALVAEIIWLLCQTIAERLRIGAVTPAGVKYIQTRLLGIRRRFQDLAARIQAGKIPRERARAPRKPRASDAESLGPMPRGWRRMKARYAERKPQPLWQALRQTRGWLLGLAPQIPNFLNSAAVCRARLEMALDDPEMQALLRTSRAVGDALRPLCWMLAIDVSRLYPARAEAACESAEPLQDAGCQHPVAASPPAASADDPAPWAGPESQDSPDFSNSA